MDTKGKRVSLRLTGLQHEEIKKRSAKAKMTMTDYIVDSSLQKEIRVVDFHPVISGLKSVENTLNQFIAFAEQNKVQTVSLEETNETLKNIDNVLDRMIYEMVYKPRGVYFEKMECAE